MARGIRVSSLQSRIDAAIAEQRKTIDWCAKALTDSEEVSNSHRAVIRESEAIIKCLEAIVGGASLSEEAE